MAIELNNTIVPGPDKIASAKFFARIFGLWVDEAEVGCDRSHTRSVEKLGIGMTPWQVANALGAAARLAQQGVWFHDPDGYRWELSVQGESNWSGLRSRAFTHTLNRKSMTASQQRARHGFCFE